jgi:hypothetical protein
VLTGNHSAWALEVVNAIAAGATSLRQWQIMKITTANRFKKILEKGDGSGELRKTRFSPLDRMVASQKANDPAADLRNFKSDMTRLLTYPNTLYATFDQLLTTAGHGALPIVERAAQGTIMAGLAAVFGMYAVKVARTQVSPDGKFQPPPNFELPPAAQRTVETIAYGSFGLGSAGLIAGYRLAHSSLLVASTLLGYARSVGNIGQAAGILGYERIQKMLAGKSVKWMAGPKYSAYDWLVTMTGALGIIGNGVAQEVGPVIEAAKDIQGDLPVPPVQGEFDHPWEGK